MSCPLILATALGDSVIILGAWRSWRNCPEPCSESVCWDPRPDLAGSQIYVPWFWDIFLGEKEKKKKERKKCLLIARQGLFTYPESWRTWWSLAWLWLITFLRTGCHHWSKLLQILQHSRERPISLPARLIEKMTVQSRSVSYYILFSGADTPIWGNVAGPTSFDVVTWLVSHLGKASL